MHNLKTLIHQHISEIWRENTIDIFSWELGPILKSLPQFQVARIRPNSSEEPWIYISVGISEVTRNNDRLEIFILAPWEEALMVELLAMLGNYYADNKLSPIKLNSIIPIGRPWIKGGRCDRLLISLPYTIGPKFEWLRVYDESVRFLWALPITEQESAFAAKYGVEKLEQKFDQARINPVDPYRESVV